MKKRGKMGNFKLPHQAGWLAGSVKCVVGHQKSRGNVLTFSAGRWNFIKEEEKRAVGPLLALVPNKMCELYLKQPTCWGTTDTTVESHENPGCSCTQFSYNYRLERGECTCSDIRSRKTIKLQYQALPLFYLLVWMSPKTPVSALG